ncbi:MAG: extracellular solute-binding protein [Pigmentiphaga sp.]
MKALYSMVLGSILIAAISTASAASSAWEQVLTAAEKEGKVTVIGPPIRSHREAIMRFEQAYPKIKVEYTGMAPGQFEARLSAERNAGQYLWDILVSGVSSTVYDRQIPNGWYDPLRAIVQDPSVLKDESWVGGFESGFLDTERRYIYSFTAEQASGITIDKRKVPETFSGKNLLDPKWKGQIAMLDPRSRGPGSVAFRQVVAALGDAGATQLLKDQEVVLADSVRQVTEWAVRGTYPIVLGVPTSEILAFQKKGLGQHLQQVHHSPDKLFFLTLWGNVALMNRAPNPNAAAVFVNWLLTKEAQEHWAKEGLVNSRRTDVPLMNPDVVVDEKTWNSGYNLSDEEHAKEGVSAMRIAEDGLK